MFGNKKDRQIIGIAIEFNVTAIGQWLRSDAEFKDIPNIDRDWKNVAVQRYAIDMFPIGLESNAYFHRSKKSLSQNISGVDYLENVTDSEVKFILDKKVKIEGLEWEMWQGCISLIVHFNGTRNLVLLTPVLSEVAVLESTGRVPKHKKASTNLIRSRMEDVEIEVPYSFGHDNKPEEFTKVWRRNSSYSSLVYYNALGRVSFSIMNGEVEY